ncbi:hypothetical protein DCAR_0624167 [Daucus carota subsp. sativus]|uniref:Uncharacterized protein n=1 Tax=Daucus carota subsp. sativus TaxID=79200 RepID=A0A161XD67_DAUCS|nr:hypothetical protein DCAR_0624167 [Daucus carota subsp. sativus]
MHKNKNTNLALSTGFDRPAHYDRSGPYPIKQYHHMKSGKIYSKLWRVEMEIAEKLQKLKIECFGDDQMNAETQSALSGIYKDEKPVRMYYQALEEKNNYFQIPKSSEAFGKLWQEELDFIKKLQKLKLNLVKLDHKKKCFSTDCGTAYVPSSTTDPRAAITLLYTTYKKYSEAAFTRLTTRQKIQWKAVKLHKGRHHGSNSLVKERQVLKKINQAREELEEMSGNSPSEPVTRIYTWRGDILDTKEALTDYIKDTTREVEELRLKQMTYRAYDGGAELEKAATENQIRILERKLENIKQKKLFQTTT